MTKDQILELINKRYITRVMSEDELKELESKTIDDLKGSGLATHIDTPEQDGNDDVKGTPVSEVIEEIKTKVEPVAKKSKKEPVESNAEADAVPVPGDSTPTVGSDDPSTSI